ncbi:MAG TPA: hypothetical protein VMD56_03060 [Steroidobacteraceae bacterium]|nr:hypothetical protein [Steroidobacteraceae bacterium]
MLIWSISACLLLLLAIVLIARLPGATLGAYSTRLLGIGVLCAGYYGAVSWLRFGVPGARPPHWQALIYVLPILAALGALYCLWRIARNWRSEVHGFVKTLLSLIVLLLLGALAWLGFTH